MQSRGSGTSGRWLQTASSGSVCSGSVVGGQSQWIHVTSHCAASRVRRWLLMEQEYTQSLANARGARARWAWAWAWAGGVAGCAKIGTGKKQRQKRRKAVCSMPWPALGLARSSSTPSPSASSTCVCSLDSGRPDDGRSVASPHPHARLSNRLVRASQSGEGRLWSVVERMPTHGADGTKQTGRRADRPTDRRKGSQPSLADSKQRHRRRPSTWQPQRYAGGDG